MPSSGGLDFKDERLGAVYMGCSLLLLLLLLQPFNGLFPRTTWVSRYQIGKTSLDLNEARDDGVWDAMALAGPYTNNLHLITDR